MSRVRLALWLILGAGLLSAPALLTPAGAAAPEKPTPPADRADKDDKADKPDKDAPAIALPTDPKIKRRLEAAQDYLAGQSWAEGVHVLQSVLDGKEDTFVRVTRKDANGEEAKVWVSASTESNRLLGSLPAAGREAYEQQFGNLARTALARAQTDKDPALLAEVARRYHWTRAGAEALPLLIREQLAAHQFALAGLQAERLLQRLPETQLTPEGLWEANRAFRLAGDQVNGDRAWHLLTLKAGKDGLRIADRTQTLKEWQAELDKLTPSATPLDRDWPLYRGDPSRSGHGPEGTPFLTPAWHLSTLSDESRSLVLDRGVKVTEARGQAILPAFFPIAVGGKLIYRDYGGVRARDLESGKIVWETDSPWSLDRCLLDGTKANYVKNQWLPMYQNMSKEEVLWGNSVVGALSTDGTRVYVVDDLMVPPVQQFYGVNPNGHPFNYGPLQDSAYQNHLQAWSLKDGKLRWQLGGPPEKEGAGPDLTDLFFLGAPLPMGGKLYVLTEKEKELRLFCLTAATGSSEWSQALATTQNKMAQDFMRRTQAANLSSSGGILVCPTNAGALFGVDLLTHDVLWAHIYREKGTQEEALPGGISFPGGIPRGDNSSATDWQVTAPIIQQGKVVFTAPDDASLRCLNLRDGSLVWQVKKADDDLYLAGVSGGKVLVVGKKDCHAYNLADGKPLWRVDTGLPSGQGVLSGDTYALPLRTAAGTKKPEICLIDVNRGVVRAHVRGRGDEAPGNLLFHEGHVFSQTVAALTAYPELKALLAQIEERLKKDPNDPVALVDRADLHLARGEWKEAVNDLKAALKNDPPRELRARAEQKLYEALTEYLRQDFNAAEKYLDEYKELCQPGPAEQQTQRLANYHFLVARGREAQGKLTEALEHYLEFGDLADKTELLAIPGEPNVHCRPDVWARSQIGLMMSKATPDQRKALEEAIRKKWDKLKKQSRLRELRSFVALYGDEFRAGREARLQLAERLTKAGTDSLLEAEQQLLLLRGQQNDPQLAGQAVEALARLNARKGFLEDAAFYYKVLRRDFAKVVVRDGETGEEIYNDLATDKRFLPYLDNPGQVWNGHKIKGERIHGIFQQNQQLYTFEPEGETLPYFQRHQVALELTFHQFRLIDRQTNEKLWEINLTRTMFQNFLMWNFNPTQPAPRFPYQTVGHVIVLNLGQIVFGIDPINKKVLWETNLLGAEGRANGFRQILPDAKDGTLLVIWQDGHFQRLGATNPVEASYVCLQTRDGLVALDPVTGRTLWTRSDIDSHNRVFGDAQHVYAVTSDTEDVPQKTRTLRSADGVEERTVPDFSAVYRLRQAVLGGRLLTSATVKERLVLRLYDIPSGKDVWHKDFAAGSLLVHSESPHLAGVIDPKGAFTVTDLRDQKDVLKASIDPKYIDKAQGATLVQDQTQFYLLINGPRDSAPNGVWSNLAPNSGIRSLPVNGEVFAWSRDTGELRWHLAVPQEMLVLSDQFAAAPVLLFSSRYQMLVGPGNRRFPFQATAVKIVDKRTGKLVYDEPDLANSPQFYEVKTDPRTDAIELVAANVKISVTVAK